MAFFQAPIRPLNASWPCPVPLRPLQAGGGRRTAGPRPLAALPRAARQEDPGRDPESLLNRGWDDLEEEGEESRHDGRDALRGRGPGQHCSSTAASCRRVARPAWQPEGCQARPAPPGRRAKASRRRRGTPSKPLLLPPALQGSAGRAARAGAAPQAALPQDQQRWRRRWRQAQEGRPPPTAECGCRPDGE